MLFIHVFCLVTGQHFLWTSLRWLIVTCPNKVYSIHISCCCSPDSVSDFVFSALVRRGLAYRSSAKETSISWFRTWFQSISVMGNVRMRAETFNHTEWSYNWKRACKESDLNYRPVTVFNLVRWKTVFVMWWSAQRMSRRGKKNRLARTELL